MSTLYDLIKMEWNENPQLTALQLIEDDYKDPGCLNEVLSQIFLHDEELADNLQHEIKEQLLKKEKVNG